MKRKKIIIIIVIILLLLGSAAFYKFYYLERKNDTGHNDVKYKKVDKTLINVGFNKGNLKKGDSVVAYLGYEVRANEAIKELSFDLVIGSSLETVDNPAITITNVKSYKNDGNHYTIYYKNGESVSDFGFINLNVTSNDSENMYILLSNVKAVDINNNYYKYDVSKTPSARNLFFKKGINDVFVTTDEEDAEYYYECEYVGLCYISNIYKNYSVITDGYNNSVIFDIENHNMIKKINNPTSLYNNYVISRDDNYQISIFNLDNNKEDKIPGIYYSIYFDIDNDITGLLVLDSFDNQDKCQALNSTVNNSWCDKNGIYLLNNGEWTIKPQKGNSVYVGYEYDACGTSDDDDEMYDLPFVVVENGKDIKVYTLSGEELDLSKTKCFNKKYKYLQYMTRYNDKRYLIFDNNGKYEVSSTHAANVEYKPNGYEADGIIAYVINNGSTYKLIDKKNGRVIKAKNCYNILELFEKVYIENSKEANEEKFYVKIKDYNDNLLYLFEDEERFNVESFKNSNFYSYGDSLYIHNVYDYVEGKTKDIEYDIKSNKIDLNYVSND